MKYAIVVPVFQNQDSIPRLLSNLSSLSEKYENDLEVVFVIDGSTDKSQEFLIESCRIQKFKSQIIDDLKIMVVLQQTHYIFFLGS